ncbi:hypothetical protein, partial [Listeria monocytogenes]|uniref:hypothetical protein n=1 Tax=Listeria monocytogenes TaxID=1639 RepID=UPI002155BEE7
MTAGNAPNDPANPAAAKLVPSTAVVVAPNPAAKEVNLLPKPKILPKPANPFINPPVIDTSFSPIISTG